MPRILHTIYSSSKPHLHPGFEGCVIQRRERLGLQQGAQLLAPFRCGTACERASVRCGRAAVTSCCMHTGGKPQHCSNQHNARVLRHRAAQAPALRRARQRGRGHVQVTSKVPHFDASVVCDLRDELAVWPCHDGWQSHTQRQKPALQVATLATRRPVIPTQRAGSRTILS